jgi:hypothetical protein
LLPQAVEVVADLKQVVAPEQVAVVAKQELMVQAELQAEPLVIKQRQ